MNSENLIEKLLSYYNVSSVAELSPLINTSQATISNWKIRNSVNPIKKKCRELGIYKEIFGDMNIQTVMNNEGQLANKVKGKQIYNPSNPNSNPNEIKNDKVDPATYNLFLEAYEKAVGEDDLKSFRLYLMEYN